ncbi:hypothetical protein ASE08_11310 [Rhizobacter sp. Root16D2]|nr:hypothetical protein ASC88_03145 [Rhizobacter sp. Root29]KQV97495.1 hypothetical protein ASC98_12675 [Rhizobacter sp. Root1238]KRB10168.1 hypothetical protein ASE08_11310 [Rhizobacter sp. Root16D2]
MAPAAVPVAADNGRSAVSWGAVLAGAAGAAALSLILMILGVGLGLSALSPWARDGVSATTFGVGTILWVTLTQVAASGMGGYLAGRLRTRWADTAVDEVYFRDTAHGFLAWAVASLATAAMLGSAIGGIVGTGVRAGGTVAAAGVAAGVTGAAGAASAVSGNSAADAMSYHADALFRRDPAAAAATAPTTSDAPPLAEVARIFAASGRAATLPPDDMRYLGQLVAQRTGLSQADAERRVTDTWNRLQTALNDAQGRARDAADTARKASTYASLWLFISLLAGAFVASLCATWGGSQRDL